MTLVHDAEKNVTLDVRARCAFSMRGKRADRPMSKLNTLSFIEIRRRLQRILTREDSREYDDSLPYEENEEVPYGFEGLSFMARYNPPGIDENMTLEDLRREGDWRWIAVFAVTGANEGHYVHVELVRGWGSYKKGMEHPGTDGERLMLWSSKTFMGRAAAQRLAGRLAELLDA